MKEERKRQLEGLYAVKVQAKTKEISKWMYEHPEDGDQEFLPSAYICEQLKETDFSVQLPYGSLKAASRCELRNNKLGTTCALLARYDALSGCGEQHDELAHIYEHNQTGAVCASVGLMLAQIQEELEGTIVTMGTPAEETTGGKCVLVEEGVFDDVDFTSRLYLDAEDNTHVVTFAMDSLGFTFRGKVAHTTAYPYLGINTLDAVNLVSTGISYLRQQLCCDTWVCGIITRSGEACNITPDLCTCKFYIRAADKAYMEEISAEIVDIARGASLMMGTQMEYRNFENIYYDLVSLESFQQLYVENAGLYGFGDFVDSDADVSGSSGVGNISHVCPMMYNELVLRGPTPAYVYDVSSLEHLRLLCADDKLRKGAISLCLTVFDLCDERQRKDVADKSDTRKE